MRKLAGVIALAILISSPSAEAALFKRAEKPAALAANTEMAVSEIQRALDEGRLLDAGRFLDEALLAGAKDARFTVLGGDLSLARGQYNAALATYREAESLPAVRGRALQGEGVALSLLGRSADALTALQKAVAEDPAAWRAWNALGSEYDTRAQWSDADAAYDHAMTGSNGDARVLNNRGYSRLLQHRRGEAIEDFVAALRKRPDLSEARTNLRLALAMDGDYDRAVAGGEPADQAAWLNNAGFAAGMRGDYAKAEDLLGRALALRSQYYGRATENLKIVRALAAQSAASPNAPK